MGENTDPVVAPRCTAADADKPAPTPAANGCSTWASGSSGARCGSGPTPTTATTTTPPTRGPPGASPAAKTTTKTETKGERTNRPARTTSPGRSPPLAAQLDRMDSGRQNWPTNGPTPTGPTRRPPRPDSSRPKTKPMQAAGRPHPGRNRPDRDPQPTAPARTTRPVVARPHPPPARRAARPDNRRKFSRTSSSGSRRCTCASTGRRSTGCPPAGRSTPASSRSCWTLRMAHAEVYSSPRQLGKGPDLADQVPARHRQKNLGVDRRVRDPPAHGRRAAPPGKGTRGAAGRVHRRGRRRVGCPPRNPRPHPAGNRRPPTATSTAQKAATSAA